MSKKTIKDVMVPIQVVLGETSLKLQDVATIGSGTIIELHSLAGEPIDVLASGEKIAKGEVVIIDENFGIRVTRLIENGD